MAESIGDLQAVPKVVTIISSILERVIEHNDAVAEVHRPPQKTALAAAFEGPSRPSIAVRSYLERIFLYANCSPSCYVVAYIYLDRFLNRHSSVTIDSYNVHRFLITSVLTAVKFMDDIFWEVLRVYLDIVVRLAACIRKDMSSDMSLIRENSLSIYWGVKTAFVFKLPGHYINRHYSNRYFAKVGGIGLMEMNYLEVDFLFGLRFNLDVQPVTFASYCSILQKQICLETTPSPVKSLCSLLEEESVDCQQKQLGSREVYGA